MNGIPENAVEIRMLREMQREYQAGEPGDELRGKVLFARDLPTEEAKFRIVAPEGFPLPGKWMLTCVNRPPRDGEQCLFAAQGRTQLLAFNAAFAGKIDAYPITNIAKMEVDE